MTEMKIKEISDFTEDGIDKTKVIFSDTKQDTEIILEGKGKIKTVVEV